MTDYTPTTERIREFYVGQRFQSELYAGRPAPGIVERYAEFDRWLSAHDAEVRAEEWDAGYEAGAEDQADCEGHRYYRDNTPGFDHWRTNPHRKAER